MKKISIIIFTFLLMINLITFSVMATQNTTSVEQTAQNEQENTEDAELIEKHAEVTSTYGRIVETKEIKEVVTGSVTDKV